MFLISSPRTASTLWCAIHADTELDDRLSTKLATGLYNREIFDCSWYTQQTVNERFEIYKSMTPRPLIKVFPGMTPNHIVEWLLDNEQAVWLERRDRLEQILSWGMCSYTRKWNTKRDKVDDHSLVYLKPDFDFITSVIAEYDRFKLAYKPDEVVYAEDIISMPKPDWKSYPQANGEINKLRFFYNWAEIVRWYNETSA